MQAETGGCDPPSIARDLHNNWASCTSERQKLETVALFLASRRLNETLKAFERETSMCLQDIHAASAMCLDSLLDAQQPGDASKHSRNIESHNLSGISHRMAGSGPTKEVALVRGPHGMTNPTDVCFADAEGGSVLTCGVDRTVAKYAVLEGSKYNPQALSSSTSLQEKWRTQALPSPAVSVTCSVSGRGFVGCMGGEVAQFDSHTGCIVSQYSPFGAASKIRRVSINDAGHVLVQGTLPSIAVISSSGHVSVRPLEKPVTSCAWLSNSEFLIGTRECTKLLRFRYDSAKIGYTAFVWDEAKSISLSTDRFVECKPLNVLYISVRNEFVVACTGANKVILLHTQSDAPIRVFYGVTMDLYDSPSAHVTEDESIVMITNQNAIDAYEVVSGQKLYDIKLSDSYPIKAMCMSTNGDRLATVAFDKTLRIVE